MTRAELRTLVLSWLDDPQGGYFTESQVNVFLNNAQKEVQKRLKKAGQNYYTKCIQTTLVVSQNDYVLPSGFTDLHRLEVVISGLAPNESKQSLMPITINQQDMIGTGTGTPQFYFVKKNRLVLLPAPDSALTLRMIYDPLVTDMSLDTDVPDVPEEYHELIALLAAEDGFIKDGRASELLIKKIATYQRDLDSDANERQQDHTRMVVETGSDSDAGMYW